MLVGVRVARDGAHVQAALVGEGGGTRIGGVGRQGHVAGLGHEIGDVGQLGEIGHAVVAQFELEVRDHGEQVGIARTLAEAVDGALDLRRARPDAREGIGHGTARVVVTVDAEGGSGQRRCGRSHDIADLVGQEATVGLAEAEGGGARLVGRTGHRERVVGIAQVTIKIVLGVEDDLDACRHKVGDGVPHHAEVLPERGLQGVFHMIRRRLAHNRDHGSAARDEVSKALVLVGQGVLAAGGPEGRNARMRQWQRPHPAEELDVLGI